MSGWTQEFVDAHNAKVRAMRTGVHKEYTGAMPAKAGGEVMKAAGSERTGSRPHDVDGDDQPSRIHSARAAGPVQEAAAGRVRSGAGGAQTPRLRPVFSQSEDDLQAQVIGFLDLFLAAPARALHIPNGGSRVLLEAIKLKRMGVKKGAADVLIIGATSPFVWIELKVGRNGLSDEQAEWRDWCISIGAPWFLCRSLDDVVAACDDAGVRLTGRPG